MIGSDYDKSLSLSFSRIYFPGIKSKECEVKLNSKTTVTRVLLFYFSLRIEVNHCTASYCSLEHLVSAAGWSGSAAAGRHF
jgi:hypothetical protein